MPPHPPQTPVGPTIRVLGLSKSFGDVKAVRDLSFDVARGECFGLLGPNGAGKSTTIKILITLLKPDKGDAEVNGFRLTRDPTRIRGSIGYVPQSLSVDGVLTGRENLAFFGKLYGLGGRDLQGRVDRVLAAFDLAGAADRPVSGYSGGMIRRLEIAQSILHRPAVVFLDEPTVGLDPTAREALWGHIRWMRREHGTTILLTTHYMEEAEGLCDRIAIMNRGTLAALGTLAELRRKAHMPRADMNRLFTRFTGGAEQTEGDFKNVRSQRRTARRLG